MDKPFGDFCFTLINAKYRTIWVAAPESKSKKDLEFKSPFLGRFTPSLLFLYLQK